MLRLPFEKVVFLEADFDLFPTIKGDRRWIFWRNLRKLGGLDVIHLF